MQTVFLNDLMNRRECTLQELIDSWWFESEELATWLTGCISFGIYFQPYQGHYDSGMYDGQPVVWDGVWEYDEGHYWYVGADGPSGGSRNTVRRLVDASDVIVIH